MSILNHQNNYVKNPIPIAIMAMFQKILDFHFNNQHQDLINDFNDLMRIKLFSDL